MNLRKISTEVDILFVCVLFLETGRMYGAWNDDGKLLNE